MRAFSKVPVANLFEKKIVKFCGSILRLENQLVRFNISILFPYWLLLLCINLPCFLSVSVQLSISVFLSCFMFVPLKFQVKICLCIINIYTDIQYMYRKNVFCVPASIYVRNSQRFYTCSNKPGDYQSLQFLSEIVLLFRYKINYVIL